MVLQEEHHLAGIIRYFPLAQYRAPQLNSCSASHKDLCLIQTLAPNPETLVHVIPTLVADSLYMQKQC